MTARLLLVTGLLNLAFAVGLGAFGAHGLKERIPADLLAVWGTGNQYHFYHAFGLVVLGILFHQFPQALHLRTAGLLMGVGILLFSGSLYLLALSGIRWLGAVTPLGGLAFIAAWLTAAYALLRGGQA